MTEFTSRRNAIVVYLNKNKNDHGDKGEFTEDVLFNITVEMSVFTKGEQINKYNAIMKAIEKQKIIKKDDPIKLIILELTGDTITLDCDAFLLDKERMKTEKYIESLNHVIIGKINDDRYAVISYIETVKQEKSGDRAHLGRSASASVKCTTFKLTGTGGKCSLLPEIIKEIIYQCVTTHYANKIPGNINAYYIPESEVTKTEKRKEAVEEAQLAAAAEAAKIKEEDKCDFKAELKSKIKNNESNEYCKVTDEGLLERIQQNIDGNKLDVDINGVNELIKTRLDGLKKVKDADEDENGRDDGKTISEKKEAFMIKEANEMYVISRQVKELYAGTTYSSVDFFKNFLLDNMTYGEEKEA